MLMRRNYLITNEINAKSLYIGYKDTTFLLIPYRVNVKNKKNPSNAGINRSC